MAHAAAMLRSYGMEAKTCQERLVAYGFFDRNADRAAQFRKHADKVFDGMGLSQHRRDLLEKCLLHEMLKYVDDDTGVDPWEKDDNDFDPDVMDHDPSRIRDEREGES